MVITPIFIFLLGRDCITMCVCPSTQANLLFPRFFKREVKLWDVEELRTVCKTGISTAIARRAFSDWKIAFSQPCAAIDLFGLGTPPPCLPDATGRRGDSRSRAQRHPRRSAPRRH